MTTAPKSYGELMGQKEEIDDFLERIEDTNKKVSKYFSF